MDVLLLRGFRRIRAGRYRRARHRARCAGRPRDGAHRRYACLCIPNLVSKEQLQSAIASTSIAFNVSHLVRPGHRGHRVITTVGVTRAFALNGISYLAIVRPPFFWSNSGHGRDIQATCGRKCVTAFATFVSAYDTRPFDYDRGRLSGTGRGALEMMPALSTSLHAAVPARDTDVGRRCRRRRDRPGVVARARCR